MDKKSIATWFKGLQDRICSGLEELDGKANFQEDLWERPQGGGGRTRVIQDGSLLEKGGVNFSAVHGPMPEKIATALGLKEGEFYATGVSIVLHPNSPHVPIIHMNVRYFEMSDGTYWFGGGIDLTPHYISRHKAREFHQGLKEVCDRHSPLYYPKFKQWADDYFFLKHRKETRGVGGIFFDRLSDGDGFTKDERWAFVQDVGDAFLPAYQNQMDYRDKSFSKVEKEWQMIRRGRYVEFNLVWDKGTKFGLDTEGRTESILMSLPKNASWFYNHQPETGSKECDTLEMLKKGINWLEV